MGGGNIARDGQLPLNTNGGQLSGGRTHGFGYFYEAILQLKGRGGRAPVGAGSHGLLSWRTAVGRWGPVFFSGQTNARLTRVAQ